MQHLSCTCFWTSVFHWQFRTYRSEPSPGLPVPGRSIRQIQSHVFLSVTISTYGSRCIESWHKRQRNCNLPMPVSLTSYTVERMLRQRMQQYQYRFLYLQDFYAKWLLHVSLATLRNEGIHYRTPQRLRSWVASMHLRASVILIFSFVSTKV